jgi:hypothetical protein
MYVIFVKTLLTNINKVIIISESSDLLPENVFGCFLRIRLSEGFHFAASGEGIVNMVTELPMKVRVACWDSKYLLNPYELNRKTLSLIL